MEEWKTGIMEELKSGILEEMEWWKDGRRGWNNGVAEMSRNGKVR